MNLTSGYRDWEDQLRPAWMASLPIAWTGVRLVLRRKLFWLLLGLALMNFLFLFATIYLKAEISVENPTIGRFAGFASTPFLLKLQQRFLTRLSTLPYKHKDGRDGQRQRMLGQCRGSAFPPRCAL